MPESAKSRTMSSMALSSRRRLPLVAFLFFVLCFAPAFSQTVPRPSVQGTLFVAEGQPYSLKCTHLSDTPDVDLTWTPPAGVFIVPPAPVRTTPAQGIYQVTSDLTGTAVRAINTGVFTCTASKNGAIAIDLFRIRVRVPPTDPVIRGPTTIGAGVTGTWNCSSDRGEPVPNLSWRRGSAAILNGISIVNVLNLDDTTFNTTSVLTYTVTSSDSGLVLVCEMTQDQTSATKSARFNVSVQLKPTVTVPGGPLTFTRGQQQQVINCTVVSSPAATAITWYKNGAVLDARDGNVQFGPTSAPSLTLTLVREQDEGSYVCSATNSEGQTNSSVVVVFVVYPPEVRTSGSEVAASLSQTVTLPCNVSAKPPVIAVTWSLRRGGVTSPVTSGSKFSGGTLSDPSLVINNFAGSDAGTYRCSANNSVGTGFVEINVTTRYAPQGISANGSRVVVIRGSDVTVVCSADAAPAATYRWTRAGQEVTATPTLRLINVTSSQAGNYTCTASNGVGTLSTVAIIEVQYPPTVNSSSSPALGTQQGGNLTIPCPVSAQPPPTDVTWSRDGITIDVTQPRYSGGTVSTPDLTILSLAAADHGVYRCSVTNNLGSATSNPVNVTVSYAPTNVRVLPSNRTSVVEGRNVTLSCLADGVPSPELSWSLNGTLFRGEASFTLYAVARANTGTYTCQASNSQGSASAIVLLDVQYEPRVTSVPGGIVTGKNGSDVTLPCSFQANPAANGMAWYRSGVILDFSNPRYSGGSLATPSLTISGFQPADVGSYTCNVSNPVGIGYVTVSTAVTYPPTNMAINPPAISVMELSPFTASCTALARPPATLTWFKDGISFQDGGTLTVASASSEHDAVFTCLAANSEGNATLDLRVNVSYAPVITINQTQYGGDLGQSITIPCHVMSNPAPSAIRWTRLVGTSITAIDVTGSGGKYSGGSVSSPSLTIHNLTSVDMGRYRCEATNSIGTAQSPEVNVTITYPPGVVTVTGPTSTVLEGTAISLRCQADGFPIPSLSWFRLTSANRIATGSTLSLTASAQDNTVFRCVAINVKGQASGSLNVSVSYKPVSAVTTPSYSVGIGGTVTLDCKVNANPAPEVNGYAWYFRGTDLSVTSRYLVVTVHNASYYGDYSCTATNSAGTSTPIVISVGQPGSTATPSTGASIESSLSVTTIVIIILIILVVIAIIILVIIFCYVRGLCSRFFGKKKARGQIHPEEGSPPDKTQPGLRAYHTGNTGSRFSSSSILSRKDVDVSLHANGTAKTPISVDDGDEVPATAAEDNTGPIISLNDAEGQKPHQLPPMKYPTDVTQSEAKRRRKRKKKKNPEQGDGEHLVEGQSHPGESTPPASGSGKPPLPPAAGETTTANGVPVTEL